MDIGGLMNRNGSPSHIHVPGDTKTSRPENRGGESTESRTTLNKES